MSKKEKLEENKKEEKECCCHNQECSCQEDNKECTCDNKCDCDNQCSCETDCECNAECNCGCENKEQDNIIESLNNKISNLEDALLRSQAELLNYRRRKDEETSRILKYAEEDILNGFLPILDNFERAISMDDNNFGDETSKFLEGFRMVYEQTKKLLDKFQVKEIECINKEFDPSFAQAISTEKKENVESGIVLKVYQKGYMYKDKVLRTAMVIVSE